GDDIISADFRAVGLVFAAAQLALDVDLRALLEAAGVFGQLAPARDAVPFGPLLALAVLQIRGLGCEREVRDGLAVRGGFGFGIAGEEANEFNVIAVNFFFSFSCPSVSGDSKRAVATPKADGERFSEGLASIFGDELFCGAVFENTQAETE